MSGLGSVLAVGGVGGGGEFVVAVAVAVGAGACGQGLAGAEVGQDVHACSAAEAGAAQDVDVHMRRIRRGVGKVGVLWVVLWLRSVSVSIAEGIASPSHL